MNIEINIKSSLQPGDWTEINIKSSLQPGDWIADHNHSLTLTCISLAIA